MSQSCVGELRSRPGSQLSMKIGKHKKDIDSTTDFNTYGAPSSSVRIQKYTGKRVIGSGKSGSKQSLMAGWKEPATPLIWLSGAWVKLSGPIARRTRKKSSRNISMY